MSDFQQLVDRYLQIWNDTDPRTRRAAIEELFADDVTFVDPMAAVEGQAGVDTLIAAVQAQFPGFVLTQLGTVDGHHEQARFGWEMGLPGRPPQVAGSDVVALAPDGRIRQVFGFLDLVPA
jgi:hypothetical protein